MYGVGLNTKTSRIQTMTVADGEQRAVYQQIGQMTRTLQKTLQELSDDNQMSETVESIPDTRERLAYVLSMTEQAVSRVLNAVDAITPVQDRIQHQARQLSADWDAAIGKRRDSAAYKSVEQNTRAFLHGLDQQVSETRDGLTDIVMAQEFQDLTGQVIKKIVELASAMETQLLTLLEHSDLKPESRKEQDSLLNGPAMPSASKSTQVLRSQAEVDSFLDELGF
jgi:chemotaxis protein CheZ